MARQPMITRTITTTKCKVLCVNIAEEKPVTIEVVIPRTYKDEKAILKQVEKAITDENMKPVHISESVEVETLYGMSEQDFIASAKVLPARGTKESAEVND